MKNWTGRRRSFLSAVILSAAGLRATCAEAADLNSLASPVLFRGDARTAYRDPAAIYHDGVFHLYFSDDLKTWHWPEATQIRGAGTESRSEPVHVWEKVEITLQASNAYANPYTDAQVWVDLSGPGFARRCYGFWDGGSTFRVRLLATCPGQWRWRSGSQPEDAGLAGRSGAFEAVPWTDAKKRAQQDCLPATLTGARPNGQYRARWFNPRTGQWHNAEHDSIKTDAEGNSVLPPFPGTPGRSDTDWALKLS